MQILRASKRKKNNEFPFFRMSVAFAFLKNFLMGDCIFALASEIDVLRRAGSPARTLWDFSNPFGEEGADVTSVYSCYF